MKLICLDIEATDAGEMLELSIISLGDKTEVYHSYFKPQRSKAWSLEPHHITPAMVQDAPRIAKEVQRIQRIIDEADGILGFAVHNDLKYLRDNRINVPKNKIIIELQNWFWYYRGKEMGIEFGAVPRLARCAEILGFDYSEESDAHSATNDTRITIDIFEKILSDNSVSNLDIDTLDEFNRAFEAEREIENKNRAKGVLVLESAKGGYILKNYSAQKAIVSEYSVRVDSRYIAEHDMRERFKKREIGPNARIYKLTSSDISFFLNYKNQYEASTEELYKHIYNQKKSAHSKFNFLMK